MITELTPEQIATFPAYIKKWIEIGTCTLPANRPEAELGVKMAYEAVGKKAPTKFFWFDSPPAGCLGVTTYFYAQEKGIALKDLTIKDVEAAAALKMNYFDCFGQHEAGWMSFYDFFRNECKLVEETEKLEGLKKITCNSGWWWGYEDVVFMCERHNVCNLDENNRIHCDDGPAVAYPDGFAIYAIHGVVVPKELIMDPTWLNAKRIKSEEDMEVKRIMTDRYGIGRYLEEVGAKVIDQDQIPVDSNNPALGLMPRALMRDDEGRQYMCGTDGSTKRVYYMNVSPDVKTCVEAHKSICQMDEDDIISNS